MLSRRLILAAAPLAKNSVALNAPATAATAIRRLAHHGPPADYKHPTMDELPVPCGSWQENHDNYQRKYNIHLLLGVGVFIISLTSCIASGALDLYLMAPDKPAPRNK